MSTVKDLKAKVLNTLNILSEQEITKTKLYQSILTADKNQKKALIACSCIFASLFSNFMQSLEITEIYKWLEILFDRFEKEGIFIKDAMDIVKKVDIVFETLSSKKELAKNEEIQFVACDYAKIWSTYFCYYESKFEKVTKIIQPLELFILTAVTVIPMACHFNQKQPFEKFANMNFNSIISLLMSEYIPVNEVISDIFSEHDKESLKNRNLQCIILDVLINIIFCKEGYMDPPLHIIRGDFIDDKFKLLINVSEKSDYEKLKTLYKK